jgi:hypothetical protein
MGDGGATRRPDGSARTHPVTEPSWRPGLAWPPYLVSRPPRTSHVGHRDHSATTVITTHVGKQRPLPAYGDSRNPASGRYSGTLWRAARGDQIADSVSTPVENCAGIAGRKLRGQRRLAVAITSSPRSLSR